jgi:hypothetical protein
MPKAPAFSTSRAPPGRKVRDEHHPPTATLTIRVNIEQMAKAFEAWENGYRAEPQKFMTADEMASAEVSQLSADRAAYFHELLTTAVGA